MKFLRRFPWHCTMVIVLAGSAGYFGDQASADSAEDWLSKGRIAYQEAKYEDAEKYYSKALEMNPGSVAAQEEWVRDRIRSKASADLLERIGVKLDDGFLPTRKDVVLKYDRKLIIRASFLKKLITDDLNDVKV